MKIKIQEKEIDLFDVTFGQVEDLFEAVKIDELEFGDRKELKAGLIRTFPDTVYNVLPIVLPMFGLDENDIKTVTIESLADVVSLILHFALSELSKCFTKSGQKRGGSDAPFFDLLFELQLSLCRQFSSLNPIGIRKEKAKEIFLLVQRLNRSQSTSKEEPGRSENDVIRRPAKDDSWF